ncbi:Ppx/GppA family phosphatase, partial [bacterium]|nr:Ppx/GppA family phosphatase [bacterium]
ECGLAIEVISGEEEARLSFLGVKSGMNLSRGRFVIFDIGGGSTEFIFAKGEHIERKFSINIGAAGLTETYLISNPVTKEELAMMLNEVQAAFADFEADGNVDALIGIGGTLTTMGAVLHRLDVHKPDIIHGYVLSLVEIERQLELYRSKTIEARKTIVGLQPERADVILAGVGIVRTILKKFAVDAVTISDRGVRHGLMIERFG